MGSPWNSIISKDRPWSSTNYLLTIFIDWGYNQPLNEQVERFGVGPRASGLNHRANC